MSDQKTPPTNNAMPSTPSSNPKSGQTTVNPPSSKMPPQPVTTTPNFAGTSPAVTPSASTPASTPSVSGVKPPIGTSHAVPQAASAPKLSGENIRPLTPPKPGMAAAMPPVKPTSDVTQPPAARPVASPTGTSGIMPPRPPMGVKGLAGASMMNGQMPSSKAPESGKVLPGLKPAEPPSIGTAPPTQANNPNNPLEQQAPKSPQPPVSKPPEAAKGISAGGGNQPPAQKPPTTANAPKKSILRFLPFVLIGVILFAALGAAAYWFMNRPTGSEPGPDQGVSTAPTKKTTLNYWGLWEPSSVLAEVISDYEKQHPELEIKYTQQSHKEYRERLQIAIADGTGPDIFRYHDTWVPMMQNELAPLPEKVMTNQEYQSTFYDVASRKLVVGDQLVGIPLMYDGLGLYYNKQIFEVANLQPPTNWLEVQQAAQALTIKSGSTITRGGIAMGTTSNVEHFGDIMGLLLYQNNANPSQPATAEGVDAVDFYESFAKDLGVWDDTLPSSTVAFYRGDVAMMLAPSWRVHEIRAMNPNLEFGIVPVPQLEGAEKATWASFWAEGVSSQSKNKEAAWQFLKYLSSPEVLRKLHSEAKKERAFGEIYPRKDMAEELLDDEYQGAYLQDVPYAKSWFLSAYTHDSGVNDRIIKYFEDAVNATSSNTQKNLETVQQGIGQVLQPYLAQ